jgi:hypothetical protein
MLNEHGEPVISRTTEIGRSLQAFSKDAEFTARRGVVAELYPYIVAASKRMSARAISRFLEEEFEVKVSAVTVAKAIRNPKKYWMFFFDTLEPYCRRIEEAHHLPLEAFLFQEEFFEQCCNEEPKYVNAAVPEVAEERTEDYWEAVRIVQEKWYGLDEELRHEAKTYLAGQLEEFEKKVNAEEK